MESSKWSLRGMLLMNKCKKLPKNEDSITDVTFAGRSMEKASIFTTCGMSRVSLFILIIAIVLIIVLPLCRILGNRHSNSYYYVPPTIEWSNGLQKWGT